MTMLVHFPNELERQSSGSSSLESIEEGETEWSDDYEEAKAKMTQFPPIALTPSCDFELFSKPQGYVKPAACRTRPWRVDLDFKKNTRPGKQVRRRTNKKSNYPVQTVIFPSEYLPDDQTPELDGSWDKMNSKSSSDGGMLVWKENKISDSGYPSDEEKGFGRENQTLRKNLTAETEVITLCDTSDCRRQNSFDSDGYQEGFSFYIKEGLSFSSASCGSPLGDERDKSFSFGSDTSPIFEQPEEKQFENFVFGGIRSSEARMASQFESPQDPLSQSIMRNFGEMSESKREKAIRLINNRIKRNDGEAAKLRANCSYEASPQKFRRSDFAVAETVAPHISFSVENRDDLFSFKDLQGELGFEEEERDRSASITESRSSSFGEAGQQVENRRLGFGGRGFQILKNIKTQYPWRS